MSNTLNLTTGVSASPVLVYDDECGFCSRSVQFVLRNERRHDLLFVARESQLGKELRRSYALESVESMIWVENGQAFAESLAAMKVAEYLGGAWAVLAGAVVLCPLALRNALYRVLASNRRRLPLKCPVPTAEQHSRFLG